MTPAHRPQVGSRYRSVQAKVPNDVGVIEVGTAEVFIGKLTCPQFPGTSAGRLAGQVRQVHFITSEVDGVVDGADVRLSTVDGRARRIEHEGKPGLVCRPS